MTTSLDEENDVVQRPTHDRDRRHGADRRRRDDRRGTLGAALAQPRRLSATILIPAHNEAATIERCVRACQAQTYPVERIVVVADACTDDTAARAAALGVEVVESDAQDKAGAQNTVLPTITSDVVVGFDGDTFPEPECVERMMAAIADGYDAVGAMVLPAQASGFFIRSRRYAYALGRRWWRWAQDTVGRIQVLTGACYAFRTEAIVAVGGFPTVGISADMDATWTLHRAGYRLRWVGDAVALTMDPETFAAYRAQMRRWASGYFQTMAKHRRGLLHPKAMLVVWTALIDLVLLPFGLVWLVREAVLDPVGHGWFWAAVAAQMAFKTLLVATVVGWREAVLGAVPYMSVNLYNKGLYLWTMVREWILGRHYASWTGRHGRRLVITAMSRRRKLALGLHAAVLVAVAAAVA